MDKQQYIDDIQEIKSIMNRSSRFLSLSGYSGILAGVYALIGSFFAYRTLYPTRAEDYGTADFIQQRNTIIVIGLSIIAASLFTSLLFTLRKAKQNKERIWSDLARRLLFHFGVPFVTGAIVVIMLWQRGEFYYLCPAMLIFYGLAAISASKFTFGSTKYLGLACLILGLINCLNLGYGLYFWAFGFGICHIIYGIAMFAKR